MLPKKGRKLPAWEGALGGREAYADVMADLLRKEHGDSHRAVKQLMRQTDASERTVKHWLAAQHGPDTVFFLRLIATSPVIRAFVLGVIESPVAGRQSFTPGHWADDEPMIDGLNERQRWFLDRVGKGFRSGARDTSYRWEVSPKTARRDIAGLRLIGRLQFIGARRNGHYQLVEDEDAQPPAH